MFSFFNKSKIEEWELKMILNAANFLPDDFSFIKTQIVDGLHKGKVRGSNVIPGYISFTYHPEKFEKYERKGERPYLIKNLKVWDENSRNYVDLSIVILSGVVAGYAIDHYRKLSINPEKVIASGYEKKFLDNSEFLEIKDIFNHSKERLINLAKEQIKNPVEPDVDINSFEQLIRILEGYTFENRIWKKGLLTRIIIDSLVIPNAVGEKFIEFDSKIK